MKPIVLILCVTSFFSCHTPTEPQPPGEEYLLTQEGTRNIEVTFTNFDRVTVTHQSGPSIKSNVFQMVGVGTSDSLGYHELMLSGSTHDSISDVFSFNFSFPLILDSSRTETLITVRYYHSESGSTDVDTTILQYKYPYSNAEIFLTYIPTPFYGYFQDIDQLGNKFYLHPTGPEGLFEYDLTTKTTRSLVNYTSGNHIAADSIFVFCEVNTKSIRRYSQVTDTIDLMFQTNQDVIGLEAYQGFLYALQGRNTTYLHRYTYNGVPVDSVLFPGTGYHLAIENGILYTYTFSTILKRVELATMTELPPVQKPADNLEGFKVLNGQLYFCDFDRRTVGFMPLMDLK